MRGERTRKNKKKTRKKQAPATTSAAIKITTKKWILGVFCSACPENLDCKKREKENKYNEKNKSKTCTVSMKMKIEREYKRRIEKNKQ